MIKLLAIPNMTFDATSYYRAAGTFKSLFRMGVDATLFENAWVKCPDGSMGMGWPSAIRYDVALFQRSVGQTAISLCQYLKDCGVKIWYDLDDDLWNIPENFKLKKYYPKKVLDEIELMISMSDLITCSTPKLSEVIKQKTGKNAHVVYNGWDYQTFGVSMKWNADGPIIWRGSNTHVKDLQAYRELFEGLNKQIIFMGYNPVIDHPKLNIKDYAYVPPLDPFKYFRTLQQLKPSAFITPLEHNEFNESKSNIAMIEANANGAICYSNFGHEFEGAEPFENIGKGSNEIFLNQLEKIRLLNDSNVERVKLIASLFPNEN